MRWISLIFVLLVLTIPLGIAVFAFMCTQTTPLIQGEAIMSSAGVERAKQLMHDHDPRKLRSGETKTVRMNQEELTLVLNHLIGRVGGGGVSLTIGDGSLSASATVDLARIMPGRYLNIVAEVREQDGVSRIEQLKLGEMPIPRRIVSAVIALAAEHLYRASGVHNAADLIRGVELKPRRLAVTYEWKAGIVDAVRSRLVSADDREKLRRYNAALASEVSEQGPRLSFASLLEALIRLAGTRSEASDPIAENRAALIVLAAYINGSSLEPVAPEASAWVVPAPRRLKLQGRRDFAQHFATSAALAVAGGDTVANAVGLFKEIDDADGGSGFSFKDLAADMAGTRFGNVAVASDARARALQQHAAQGFADRDLIPAVDGLQEQLTDAQFNAAYGGVGGEKYKLVVQDIEHRIAALEIYAR